MTYRQARALERLLWALVFLMLFSILPADAPLPAQALLLFGAGWYIARVVLHLDEWQAGAVDWRDWDPASYAEETTEEGVRP